MLTAIWTWLKLLLGYKIIIPDEVKSNSVPAVGTTISSVTAKAPTIDKPTTSEAVRPYMTGPMVALLALIRKHESGTAGYNADFRNNNKWTLVNRSFDDVFMLSRKQVANGEASSAIGAYQFLSATLASLKGSLKLKGTEIFDEDFQDDLAVALMIRRGYMDYMRGNLGEISFCNNLAKEWASLPVVSPIQGAHRKLKVGQSYYAGDGLNAALVTAPALRAAISALRLKPWF